MQIFWIKTEQSKLLAIVPRPRGGDWLEDEIYAMRREGVDVLVSLLTAPEQDELGLLLESSACEKAGIEYLQFPIADREVPASHASLRPLVERLLVALEEGKSVAVHCRAGIGRSSLLLASLLCRRGLTATEAFEKLSQARGLAVPDTPEQVRWVEGFARSLN